MEDLLKMILPFLSNIKFLGELTAHALALLVGMGLIIECVELIAAMTASKKDDAAVAKIKAIKDKVIAVLEIIPHANIPVASGILKLLAWIRKGAAVLKAMLLAMKDK